MTLRTLIAGSLILFAAGVGCGYVWFHTPPTPPQVVTIVKRQAAQAETLYVHDTVRFTQWKTNYDTVRTAVVQHLTDTVEVLRYIRTADSTIQSCTRALTSCTHALNAAKMVIAVEQPSSRKLPTWLTVTASAAAGFWLGRQMH